MFAAFVLLVASTTVSARGALPAGALLSSSVSSGQSPSPAAPAASSASTPTTPSAPTTSISPLAAEFEALFERALRGDEPALRELVAGGETVAARLAERFQDPSPARRRLAALVVERSGARAGLDAALSGLDPSAVADADVRASLARYLAHPLLSDAASSARVAALDARLRTDPDRGVRAAAARSLSELAAPDALRVLDAALDGLAAEERAEYAGFVARLPRGRDLAWARLVRAARGDEDPLVHAALLVPCARALADGVEDGREPDAAARALILSSIRHPDPRVRGAGWSAYETLVTRLLTQRRRDSASSVLAAFEADGVAPEMVLPQRVRVAMHAGDARASLEFARRLAVVAGAGDDDAARALRVRALRLEAAAHLALDDFDAARRALAAAHVRAEAWLSERRDLATKTGRERQIEVLSSSAVACLAEAAVEIAAHLPRPTDASARVPELESVPLAALEALRRAHVHSLEAQIVARRGDVEAANDLDRLFDDTEGIVVLVLDSTRHAAWPENRGFALRRSLGRALATVVPTEVVGFEPYPAPEGLAFELDPRRDPLRRAQLVALLTAEADRFARELGRRRQSLLRASLADPAGAPPRVELDLMELEFRWREALDAQRRVADGEGDASDQDLLELRAPVSWVVDLGRALREAGRPAEARDLLFSARRALEASDVAQRFFWGIGLRAQVELALGGTLSDAGDGAQAELELSKAVARLDELEARLLERGVTRTQTTPIRMERCNALVALAVNANVKLHDPKKALEWFEKAWELRQDDFMRVLYACYRARDGRVLEARALIADVVPGPNVDYNLACTYALLGERELALEFLRRELDLDPISPGVRARQVEWARTDPDLVALRDDPRFEAVLRGPDVPAEPR